VPGAAVVTGAAGSVAVVEGALNTVVEGRTIESATSEPHPARMVTRKAVMTTRKEDIRRI